MDLPKQYRDNGSSEALAEQKDKHQYFAIFKGTGAKRKKRLIGKEVII